MSNDSSKYKDKIDEFRKEGKSYKEISKTLGCSYSIISYYTSSKQQERARQLRKLKNNYRKEIRKISKERNREFVTEYLKIHPCVDCGNADIRVLEFDHINNDKEENISHTVRNAWALDRLTAEIAKCEVRCCNCHRIVTIERRHK